MPPRVRRRHDHFGAAAGRVAVRVRLEVTPRRVAVGSRIERPRCAGRRAVCGRCASGPHDSGSSRRESMHCWRVRHAPPACEALCGTAIASMSTRPGRMPVMARAMVAAKLAALPHGLISMPQLRHPPKQKLRNGQRWPGVCAAMLLIVARLSLCIRSSKRRFPLPRRRQTLIRFMRAAAPAASDRTRPRSGARLGSRSAAGAWRDRGRPLTNPIPPVPARRQWA